MSDQEIRASPFKDRPFSYFTRVWKIRISGFCIKAIDPIEYGLCHKVRKLTLPL